MSSPFDHLIPELRKQLTTEANDMLTDNDCCRFLMARNGIIAKTVEMIKEWVEWRHNFLPTIAPKNLQMSPNFILMNPDRPDDHPFIHLVPACLHGFDREGSPIYFERTGYIQSTFNQVKKHLTMAELIQFHIVVQEENELRFKFASERFGKEISKATVVMDFKHLAMSTDLEAINYLKSILEVDQKYYPERLKRLIGINCPWYFSTLYAILKPFIDKRTAEKFLFMGSDLTKLFEHIDPSVLPTEMGGQYQNTPWGSYSEDSGVSVESVEAFFEEKYNKDVIQQLLRPDELEAFIKVLAAYGDKYEDKVDQLQSLLGRQQSSSSPSSSPPPSFTATLAHTGETAPLTSLEGGNAPPCDATATEHSSETTAPSSIPTSLSPRLSPVAAPQTIAELFKVSIQGADINKSFGGHVSYTILVEYKGQAKWKTSRTKSEFVTLNDTLQRLPKFAGKLPPLPAKVYIGKKSSKVVRGRVEVLSEFLSRAVNLLDEPPTSHQGKFLLFFVDPRMRYKQADAIMLETEQKATEEQQQKGEDLAGGASSGIGGIGVDDDAARAAGRGLSSPRGDSTTSWTLPSASSGEGNSSDSSSSSGGPNGENKLVNAHPVPFLWTLNDHAAVAVLLPCLLLMTDFNAAMVLLCLLAYVRLRQKVLSGKILDLLPKVPNQGTGSANSSTPPPTTVISTTAGTASAPESSPSQPAPSNIAAKVVGGSQMAGQVDGGQSAIKSTPANQATSGGEDPERVLITTFLAAGVGPKASRKMATTLHRDHGVDTVDKLVAGLQYGELGEVLVSIGINTLDVKLVLKRVQAIALGAAPDDNADPFAPPKAPVSAGGAGAGVAGYGVSGVGGADVGSGGVHADCFSAEALVALMKMGFSEAQSREALTATGGTLDAAYARLVKASLTASATVTTGTAAPDGSAVPAVHGTLPAEASGGVGSDASAARTSPDSVDAAAKEVRPSVDDTAKEVRPSVDDTAKEVRPSVDDTAKEVRPSVDATAKEVRPSVDATAEYAVLMKYFMGAGLGPKASKAIAMSLLEEHGVSTVDQLKEANAKGELERMLASVVRDVDLKLLQNALL